jgi:lauroyl/myristoyl acyltransferase
LRAGICDRRGRILAQQKEAVDVDAGQGGARDSIVHKARRYEAQPAWSLGDLGTIAGLILLLAPAWLLPESWWGPLWRARVRLKLLTNRKAVRYAAKHIRAALGVDPRAAERISQDLRAAVHEMQMQDLRAWRPGGWQPNITLEGEEHLQAALAQGKGAIVWIAPFVFNSGPTKMALHRKGYRVSHLSSPKHGFSETRFGVACLNKVRCIPEDRHIAQRIIFDRYAPATAMRRLMRAAKAGEVVSIVAASTEGSDMIKSTIFGGRLPIAVGAPRLAGLTGAPLLPLFTVRDGEGFRVAIEAPIALADGLDTDARCIAAAAEFLRRSDPWVRKFPEQWRAWSKWRAG